MGEFDLDIRHSYRVFFLDIYICVYFFSFPRILEIINTDELRDQSKSCLGGILSEIGYEKENL